MRSGRRSGRTSVFQIGEMKSRHESRSDDTKTRTASEMMNMYRDSTLRGAGGRMPKRRITKARTSTSTACRKRERRNLIGLFQGQEEGHEIDVLLRREPGAEVLRHDPGREPGHRPRALRIEDLLHDVVGRLDLGDLREVGADRRGADLARLVARDARALALEDRFAALGIAEDLELGGRRGAAARAHAGRDVVQRDVHGPAERLEESRERPDLGAVQRDRRLVHGRHDRRVALDDVRRRLQQRLDDVGLGAHARLRLAGAGADPPEVWRARPLLANPVTDLARALRLENFFTSLDELSRGDIATLERQLLRRLGLDLRNGVREARIAGHHQHGEGSDLDDDGDPHQRSRSLPPAIAGTTCPWPSALPLSPRPPSQKMNSTSRKNESVTSVMTLAAQPRAGVAASTEVSRMTP